MDAFLRILSQPDNMPIAGMAVVLVFLLGVWIRQVGRPAVAQEAVATWPNLVRIELLATLAAMILLTVWSILVDAPLEGPAELNRTPDPAKAPWYFLGLQELLVYFDPWIAGVMVPLFIIVGLLLVPYLDRNPRGSGIYTVRERPFAIATFLFGFLVLWIVPILIGVFCRGPGWGWYWPWESWDVRHEVDLRSVNLSDVLGVQSDLGATVVGAGSVLVWYGLGVAYWLRRRRTPALEALGGWRYAITAFLFLTMAAIPIKMALHLALNIKYVWVTPWFNI